MPYFPSSSCEMESSSSLRHCVTTLRSLLRIFSSMSHRDLRLRRCRLLLQFVEPPPHEVIQCKANDPNCFDRLFRPRKADLLSGARGGFLRTVGPMDDIVATFHRGIECLFDFFL